MSQSPAPPTPVESHNCSQQSGRYQSQRLRANERAPEGRDVPQALPLPLPLPAGCRSCFRPLGGLGGYTVVSYQGMIIPTAIPTMIPKRSSDFLRVFFDSLPACPPQGMDLAMTRLYNRVRSQ
jgi:hypothetical protein